MKILDQYTPVVECLESGGASPLCATGREACSLAAAGRRKIFARGRGFIRLLLPFTWPRFTRRGRMQDSEKNLVLLVKRSKDRGRLH